MSTLLEYKCPCCGGAIKFDVDAGKPKCPYCDTEYELDALKAYDEALKESTDDMHWESTDKAFGDDTGLCVYSCNSCGGEIVADEHRAAMSCPYCDNPVIMTGKLSGELMPDIVIPFKYDKKAAKEGLFNHFKGKTLLPKVFKDENHIDEIKGIYVPFWLYDADVDADMKYRATRIRMWSDSNYNYTKTSHYLVTRGGELGFENVPVDGSANMADDLMESIEPYDMSQAVDFQTAYLSGYLADKYSVSSQESAPRANERIKRSTEDEFRSTVIGYNTVVCQNSNIRLSRARTRYALLPVWILSTTWKDEKYVFAMNGQTGKFVGNLPLDKGAYARWLLSLTGIVGALTMLATYLYYLWG